MDELTLRLKSWEEGLTNYPIKIEFWPTNRCNLNCKYCRGSNLEKNYPPELSDDRILKLIDESACLKVKEWIIAGGGEPLFRKEIVLKMIKKIKDYGMYGALTTNGTLFDKHMIKQLIQMKWDVVFFSIDGYNIETNDFLRKDGAFKKVYNHLKIFQKMKPDKNAKPLIGFSSVLTNTNYKHIKKLIRLAYKVGCEHVIINPLKGNNTIYNERLKLNSNQIEELRKQIPELVRFSENLNIKTTLPILNTDLVEKSSGITKDSPKQSDSKKLSFKHVKCYEPWTSILINPEGKVGPCCERPEDSHTLNIKELSLKEIWFSDYFQNVRNNLLKGIFDKMCFTCNAWKITSTEHIRSQLKD